MQQLSELDSSFVQQESTRTPMHISPVVIYDQSARNAQNPLPDLWLEPYRTGPV